MKKTQYSFLAISIALASQVHAAGFQVVEHSASGLGRAFSGDGAIGDNASEISATPAVMTLFDKAQLSGAISFIDPEIDVYDETSGQQSNDVAPFQVVPAAYYVSPINDQWAWGIGMFTSYGVTTDYPTDIDAGDMAGKTSLVSFNINPNIAYRINDHFSLGAGVSLVYAQAELKRTQGSLSQFTGGNPSDSLIKMEGDTLGYGWNVGGLYEVNENNRFSASYRSAVDLKFKDGDFTDYSGSILGSPGKVNADLDIELPDIVELAGFHQLNKQWAIHYSWQWTNYSKFQELRATSDQCSSGTCFQKTEYYEDNQRWAIGTTYQANEAWIFRAGFAYDEQAGKATLSIPDSDRYWYSAGLTYIWSPNLSVDAGFTLVSSKKGSFTETNAIGQTSTFSSEGPAYISAVQLNYTFN
ncbi:outer membrane protein transport protein [Vibrio casei]|uniref:Long-chain fatty acid transporter n=1 Tax=Vibrio casei TaxID=673372 RepID=A0A368LMG6_9VIBR|nr:outer membrane protein transport protein [Vibrio casei]RCS73099.1 long-chain fatty acid transporter [Vibrio casei]SJN40834.1 Long-chain fatty acid transport protein [Vibrio casei]